MSSYDYLTLRQENQSLIVHMAILLQRELVLLFIEMLYII